MRWVLYLFFSYCSVAREVDYLSVRFDYFLTHGRENVHGFTKPPAMHFLGFRKATLMVKPLHKIVPFMLYEWRYICGFPRQECLRHLFLKLVDVQSCVRSNKGLMFYAVVQYFGRRQTSQYFSPRATLKLSDSPFRHDIPGGVRIGLFNLTAELPCLLSELTKCLFF